MNFIYHGVQCLRFVSSSKVNNIKWFFEKSFFSRSFRRTHQTSRKLYLLRRNVASLRPLYAYGICVYRYHVIIIFIYIKKKKKGYVCVREH